MVERDLVDRWPRGGVTVLTGAGISTATGIPDFRGPSGEWTVHPERARLLDIDAYRTDPGVRRAGWQAWAASPVWEATPTRAHQALVELERAGMLTGIITQNFDGLHAAAGSSPGLVSEVHGTLRTTSCLRCGRTLATTQVIARLGAEPDPHCPCGGILKVDVTYFGEMLPERAFARALSASRAGALFVVVGSTLTVQPVASLPLEALEAGADLVIANRDATPYDRYAEQILRGEIEEEVPELVADLVAQGGAPG